MLNLETPHLAALAEVIRTGSFDRAAAALGVTPSAISQRIRALEERLGTVLVVRGQPCTGTETGRRLCRHAEEVALLEHALTRDIGRLSATDGPRPVRIAANADSLATWLPAALAQAADAEPDLRFDLVLDDQDHSADWLRRGEVVAAVSAHVTPVQGCDSISLGAQRFFATASPAFAARHFPHGVTAEALARAPVLVFNRKDSLQARWVALKTGAPPAFVAHYLPSAHAFTDASVLGLGWGMIPDTLSAPFVASGDLVVLDPDLPLETPLYWQVSRVARQALTPLSRAVRQAAAEVLAG